MTKSKRARLEAQAMIFLGSGVHEQLTAQAGEMFCDGCIPEGSKPEDELVLAASYLGYSLDSIPGFGAYYACKAAGIL